MIHPLSYGRSKAGKHIIPRWLIYSQDKDKQHVVVDMEEGGPAPGTPPNGHKSFKEAKKSVRRLRKEYGTWTRSEF